MKIGIMKMQICIIQEGEHVIALDKDKARKKLVLGIDKEENAIILDEEEKPNTPKAYQFNEVSFGVKLKIADDAFDELPQTLPLLIP